MYILFNYFIFTLFSFIYIYIKIELKKVFFTFFNSIFCLLMISIFCWGKPYTLLKKYSKITY